MANSYSSYDRATTKKMAKHNRSGGHVRTPVRKTAGASRKDLYDRAKFGARKAQQILTRGDALKDPQGKPTPSAMQFRWWAYPIPKTMTQIRAILKHANAAKKRLKLLTK